jgi:hypothetical protein
MEFITYCIIMSNLTFIVQPCYKKKSPSLDKERESIAMKNKNVCIEITLFIFSFRNVS